MVTPLCTFEVEIRLPKAALSTISDTQIELHTDRNQQLAQVEGAQDGAGGMLNLQYDAKGMDLAAVRAVCSSVSLGNDRYA